MPLDVRIFGSEFHAKATDAEWRAGVTLWLKAWHQVPASSLPDDDIALARLAEFGRNVKGWQKVRKNALRGWIKCEDGRLYNPILSKEAQLAWTKRLAFRERSRKASEKRWGAENSQSDDASSNAQGMLEGVLEQSALHELNNAKGQGSDSDGTGQGRDLKEESVATATGAADASPTADKAFWDNAKAYLAPYTKGDPGKLVGKWLKGHGKPATASAITAAQVDRAAEPISFIEGCLKKSGANGTDHRHVYGGASNQSGIPW